MIGWIIAAAVALALAKKQEAVGGTQASGTNITQGPISGIFGVHPITTGPVREANPNQITTFQQWQNGLFIPVPTGSRQDIIATGGATSDNYNNQIVGLQIASGGPTVINPPNVGGSGGASPSGGGGGAAPGGGGGGTAPSGGGGFSGGGGRRVLLL